MPGKKKGLFLFYCLLAVAGVWLVAKIILGPFHDKLTTLSQAVLLEEGRMKKGLSLLEKKDVINKEYDKYASYFSLVGSSDESAMAGFSKELEEIGREAGITLVEIKPQKEAESDKFSKQYQISVKAEANMMQLVKFLYELHNSPLLFGVEKMTLVPKSEDSPSLNVVMTVVGVSFL